MKLADLLRKLADVIAAAEADAETPQQNQAELAPVTVSNTDDSEPGVFVPPLQAKLELLKKSVDVDNVYDRAQDHDGQDSEDELDMVKKLSGITMRHEAADDEPLDQ